MYKDKTLCAVVPAHNEERQIPRVLASMPPYVDRIVVVNDCSADGTGRAVREMCRRDDRIVCIDHECNQGVGGSIATGYKWARDNGMDIAVVMAGDAQMDPRDLPAILDPVADGRADYSKGNRLFTGEAYRIIPKVRYFGNAILSFLTKIASGYWHIADSQSGYAAINRKALELIDWERMYKSYGQPNDILVRLNVYDLRVKDVPVNPVYNVGEKSGIRIWKVVFTISWLLFRLFLWRMKEKYVIRNFHPLIFFYALASVLSAASLALFVRLVLLWIRNGFVPEMTFLALVFCGVSGLQSLFFGMWFDMENNKELR